MAIKTVIEEIENDVIDVVNTDFNYYKTKYVPSSEDSVLTFERGIEKKGKVIETCVLFVDIRNSVALTEKHHTQTMGRIYTAFTKAVIKAAHYHNGFVRNIIGDRVMVVFPADNCFTNSVDCAITINHIAQYVISKKFKEVDFKCGIGIDYGKLRVVKVGVQKKGDERIENKGLVWVGYPANLASRLTDVANKSITEEYYLVTYNPNNLNAQLARLKSMLIGFPTLHSSTDQRAPLYLDKAETVEMSPTEFLNNISSVREGNLIISSGRVVKLEKKSRALNYDPIFMTAAVLNGLKNNNPKRKDIEDGYWKEFKHPINNVKAKVYGGNLHWAIN